jgi:RNA polymerase sigma-70 factor (ECF subfamily)
MIADTKAVPSDAALVSAMASGDQGAMGQLYDRYSPIVYSIALRVLGDAGMAEDLLQEIFMQLWRNPRAFDSKRGTLAPWLVAITRNRAIDWLRKRRPETPVAEVAISIEPDLASKTEFARSVGKIRAMLDRMPTAQKDLLEMAYFEGLTHSEIAARTGQPLGTIKTRIRSGLLALRMALTQ